MVGGSCLVIAPSKKIKKGFARNQQSTRKAQRYVDDKEVPAPSVITLNAVGAAQAANDLLFYMTGLKNADASTAYM